MSFILCSGGLGNQMFQYAYLLHLRETGKEVMLDTSFFNYNNIHSGYMLERTFGINDGVNKPDHYNMLWRILYFFMIKMRINRLFFIYMQQDELFIDETKIRKMTILYGFWQGTRFFSDVEKKVKESFTFQNLLEATINFGNKISSEKSVAIHIRRGDYLKNPKYVNLSSTQYYKNALRIVEEKINKPNLYVFSDDMDWCRECGLFNNATFVDFTNEAYEDMYLMSKARGIIIANSSFSWWAGYLGEHKFVIRPERYLVEWTTEQDKCLFPEEWIIGRLEK